MVGGDASDAPSPLMPIGMVEEIGYRFPLGRVGVELLPSVGGSFGLRLGWHRAKTVVSVFETTALRPLAEVTRGGQTFPLFFTQHGRQKRGRVRLAGRRKTAKSPQCALRFLTTVAGREDKLSWQWRISATRAALAQPVPINAPPDSVTLFLPLAPGRVQIFLPPGVRSGEPIRVAAAWVNDLVVTVAAHAEWAGGVCDLAPVLEAAAKGFRLTLPGACLEAGGVTMGWETWVAPARTEAEALQALLNHCAHRADAAQIPDARPGDFLTLLGKQAQTTLMDDARVDKKGADRLLLRANTGERDLHLAGDGADAARVAHALLTRFYLTGDDALRRRARLLAHGVTEFQITDENSPHWGALRDACFKRKTFGDKNGGQTVGVAPTARAAHGLHLLHAHFKTDSLHRTALNAAQWLLLKTDKNGRLPFGRFGETGAPSENTCESGWHVTETLLPLVETFRATQNDIYLKAALRVSHTLFDDLTHGHLSYEHATTEQLSAAIEGVLHVSREYERPELIAFAQRLGVSLRSRRLPDGTFAEPSANGLQTPSLSPLAPLLASAQAGLALIRVDDAPVWPLLVLRALRAAGRFAEAHPERTTLSDWGGLCALPTGLLLGLAARVSGCSPNRDEVTVKRGWHTFSPEPMAFDYVRVSAVVPDAAPDDAPIPVDFLPLVCPITLQVLVLVLAPGGVTHVLITKNGRVPYVKNLLTGDYDQTAELVALGDGNEAMAGVFLADT